MVNQDDNANTHLPSYCMIPDNEKWRIPLVREIMDAKSGIIEVANFTTEELDTINEFACCSSLISLSHIGKPSLAVFYRLFFPKTDASLSHVSVTKNHIVNIIDNFNSNKANGYDGISATMLKLGPAEVAIPLQIIFNKCINSGMFPDSWNYANV